MLSIGATLKEADCQRELVSLHKYHPVVMGCCLSPELAEVHQGSIQPRDLASSSLIYFQTDST